MKTSIHISVIDQHINSTDARHFNTLTGLIWSTCLCVYTSDIAIQLHCLSFVFQTHSSELVCRTCAVNMWGGLLMDTFVHAEVELSGPSNHKITLRRSVFQSGTMILDNKCNLWVGEAKSRYINSETWCGAWPMTGASWMKCWMDSLRSSQVEVNSNPSRGVARLTNKPLRVQDGDCEYPLPAYGEQWLKTRIKAKVWN